MSNQSIREQLENAGYTITICMSGNIIAKNNTSSYMAESFAELFKTINNSQC